MGRMSRARCCSVSVDFTLITLFFLSLVLLSPCNFLGFSSFSSSTFFNSPPFPSLPAQGWIHSHVLHHHEGMWPVESQSDTLKYDVTALTYILSQGHARVGGSIVFRALWKQLSSKSEIGVRVRGGKTSKPLKSALHFTEQSASLILLISIRVWKRINEEGNPQEFLFKSVLGFWWKYLGRLICVLCTVWW